MRCPFCQRTDHEVTTDPKTLIGQKEYVKLCPVVARIRAETLGNRLPNEHIQPEKKSWSIG